MVLRSLMVVCLIISIAPIAQAAQQQSQPFFAGGGAMRLNDGRAQELFSDLGWEAYIGYYDDRSVGLTGVPRLDLGYARSADGDNRYDMVHVMYTEMISLDQNNRFYLGIGIGTTYGDLKYTENAQTYRADEWQPAGKAILGLHLNQMVFAEAKYHYVPDVGGIGSDYFALKLGFWLY